MSQIPLLSLPPELEGAISVILIPIVTTLIDKVVHSLYDRKVFQPIWDGLKKRYKAWRTKRNKISADYEFSIYLDDKPASEQIQEIVDSIFQRVDAESEGDFELVEKKWSADGDEIDAKIRYKGQGEPYELTLNFIPDQGGLETGPSVTEFGSTIGSIGINITFRFEFGKLRNSIIDLMLFARFLRDSANAVLSTRSATDGRFVVSPIENDLTLDDWIRKEQFDVSLLLESEDGRSSVEFYSDKAVISSPHTDVDNETVEYIRATLLNYYL
jgi:hypothetical protein